MCPSPGAPVRVLCVAGSPRARGNSARLLDACIEGIEGAGGVADVVRLSGSRLKGCTGCDLCSGNGACVLDDEMTGYYPRIDAADAIVVASPVYFAGVPSVLKAFYDRCQPYWVRRYLLGQPVPDPRRPGGLLVVGSGTDPYGSGCAVTTTRSVFAVLGVAVDELLQVEGPDGAGEIDEYPDSIDRARDVGSRLVSTVLERRRDA